MTRHKRLARDDLRASLTRQLNATRDTADEMALTFDGCDDPMHPHMPVPGPFRDWVDFVDRIARPLVESDDNDIEQAAMQLYRKANPYFICTALVMAANRVAGLEGP